MANCDVLIVGGGPAGLTAALCLARYRRSVVLFDGGPGRWSHHQINHNYLGFPGGVAATDLHAAGRRQLADYSEVEVVTDAVAGLAVSDGGFTATVGGGRSVSGRSVVLATGVRDRFPAFDGWQECVGRSLFWCLGCDGYESAGARVVVVGEGDAAAGEALQLTRFTDSVTVLTPSDCLSARTRDLLAAHRVEVVIGRPLRGLGPDGGTPCSGGLAALDLGQGRRLAAERVFAVGGSMPETALATSLGVRLAENGWIEVDTEQRTSVGRVYAAGDVTRIHSHQIATAVHEGTQAAAAATFDLYRVLEPDLQALSA